MSQYDFGTIDPYTDDGVTLADMLNNWRDAVHSWHRGAARPSYAVPGMAWINDTGGPTNWLVMVYLGPSVGDLMLFTYDTTTGAISASAAILLAQSAANPSMRWNATGNAADVKAWRATVPAAGTLRFGAYNDAGVEVGAIVFNRDGKLIADLSLATGLPPQGVFIGTAPPGSPLVGQQWWKSDDGVMYLRYDDGNSVQWVPAVPVGGVTGSTLLQTVDGRNGNLQSASVGIALNDTVPLVTAGFQYFSTSITPRKASSTLEVDFLVDFTTNPSDHTIFAMFRDGLNPAIATGYVLTPGPTSGAQCVIKARVPANAASPTTFTVRGGTNGASPIYVNGTTTGRLMGGTLASGLIIKEWS